MSDRPPMMNTDSYARTATYRADSDYHYETTRTPPTRSHQISRSKDQIQKVAGVTDGFCSVITQAVLAHPWIVLRRQCQVHSGAERSHLTPFTLIPVMINLHAHQSWMWKGFSSVLITHGIRMVSESAISEFTPLPIEIASHKSLKKLVQHLGLKSLAFTMTTPFYVSTFLETVESRIASDSPGTFDCVKEGVQRLLGRGMPQSPRLIPIWHLLLPTVTFKLGQYVIQSISHYTVTSAIRREQQEARDQSTPVDARSVSRSIYEQYFPEFLAAFTGNLLADLMMYPFETVLHRLYVQGTRVLIDNTDTGIEVIPIKTHYEGFLDCLKSIITEEGIQGLYQGFGALVLQYLIHAGILRLGIFLFDKFSQEHETSGSGASRLTKPPN